MRGPSQAIKAHKNGMNNQMGQGQFSPCQGNPRVGSIPTAGIGLATIRVVERGQVVGGVDRLPVRRPLDSFDRTWECRLSPARHPAIE